MASKSTALELFTHRNEKNVMVCQINKRMLLAPLDPGYQANKMAQATTTAAIAKVNESPTKDHSANATSIATAPLRDVTCPRDRSEVHQCTV
jgi:hypothetical protein